MDETRKGTCNETTSCLTAHEPTKKMIRAGQYAKNGWTSAIHTTDRSRVDAIYRAMEAARVGERG